VNSFYVLGKIRLLSLRNYIMRAEKGRGRRSFFVVMLGMVFWFGLLVLSSRVLIYFQSVEVIGDLLAHYLLELILLVIFSLLVFSNIITALSNLYLSRDLELCHSSPVPIESLFLSRSVFTLVDSSWMLLIFGLPVLLAYGYVYHGGTGFYVSLIHMNLALVLVATGIGVLVTMLLVVLFPARRTRDVVMLLSIFVLIAMYLLFRFIRPERLVNPDSFFSTVAYLSVFTGIRSPYLPTHWVADTLWGYLVGKGGHHLFDGLLIWSTAAALCVINIWVGSAVYFHGFSKAQEAKGRPIKRKTSLVPMRRIFGSRLGQDIAVVMGKDVRTFFRDNTQWSQLLLLGALVIVYVYNFSVLPLDKVSVRLDVVREELAFFNLALAGFVLSAVAARFVFTAVSAENGAFWVIRSSPMNPKRYMWGKFFFFTGPMIILGEVLVIFTNHFLQVSPFMVALSMATMALFCLGIVSLGLGFGASYPKFDYENISRVALGLGGALFMVVSSLFVGGVTILEAGPMYGIFMAMLKGNEVSTYQWIYFTCVQIGVCLLTGLVLYKAMGKAVHAMERYE